MILMPPMSDPSEPSERMERADNPSKALTYALILGGLGAAGAAAYFLMRPRRTPLPSAELIASGAVPGVSLNADQIPSNQQVGIQVAANPFANTNVSVGATGASSDAEMNQKVMDLYNWSRPILAFAYGVPMQGASMAGYRRLNGPMGFSLRDGLGAVADAASSVADRAAEAQRQVAAAEAAILAAQRAAAAPVPDYGWNEVMEWLKTGRLPMTRNKPAWNYAARSVGALGSNYFSTQGYQQFNFGNNSNFYTGVAGTCYTADQVLLLHGYTRQMYDLWVRGGANATAIPQCTTWAVTATMRNTPFKFLQSDLNKG